MVCGPQPLQARRSGDTTTEPSLATTPDSSAEGQRRIWIAYVDLTEENAIDTGEPGLHNLELTSPFNNPEESTYVPCPYEANRYGDYIGSVRLPIPSLTVAAWADSRRGCVSPGNDLHVQATVG